MAAESNARLLESSDFNKDRIELDGLEGFFEDDHAELYSKGLSIKQAVFYYGDTRKSLKAKVENGTVPAIRLPDSHGKKWRVFPDGVPEQLRELVPKKLRSKEPEKDKDLHLPKNEELIDSDDSGQPGTAKNKLRGRVEPKKAKSAALATKSGKRMVAEPISSVVNTVEPELSEAAIADTIVEASTDKTVIEEANVENPVEVVNLNNAVEEAKLGNLGEVITSDNTVEAAKSGELVIDAEPVYVTEAANNLDFSIPGIDYPGQLILKAAGFLVGDQEESFLPDLNLSTLIQLAQEPIKLESDVISVHKNDIESIGMSQTVRTVISNNFADSAQASTLSMLLEYTHTENRYAEPLPSKVEYASAFGPALFNSRQNVQSSTFKPVRTESRKPELGDELLAAASKIYPEPIPNSIQASLAVQAPEAASQYMRLFEKISKLEEQLAAVSYRNNYLETRLTGLEDQVKFLSQSHYQNRSGNKSFNKLLLVIPALVFVAAMLLFRFAGQSQF